MASIRRTLSPVPRPGTALNGEACSVASPLSRSSQSAQSYPPSGGLLSSLFGPLEKRSKPKGPTWRRALFHFSICFVLGMFIGFTPFTSVNVSTNPMSKQHTFLFEMNSAVENLQTDVAVSRNTTSLDSRSLKNSTTLDPPQPKEWELLDVISYDTAENVSVSENTPEEVRNPLIIVTPTNNGPFQAYYLNRLAQTLKLVPPPLLWVVVEMNSQSPETASILRKTGAVYRHLVCDKNVSELKDRRVHQRNAVLSHIELHRLDGIVYFADAENIYSPDLFEHIRKIRRLGTWKVAKMDGKKGAAAFEGPVCNGTEVIGWHFNGSNKRSRRFHAELSGFAFNSTILWDPKRWHRPTPDLIRQVDEVKEGFRVSNLIEQIVEDESQMEGLPPDCAKILVWDLHLKPSNPLYPQTWLTKNNLDATAPLA